MRYWFVVLGLATALNVPAAAQMDAPREEPERRTFRRDFVRDQRAIWTSPLHVKRADLKWILPLAGGLTALLVTDVRTTNSLSNSRDQLGVSRGISHLGAPYSTFGAAAAFQLFGAITGNQKARRTGVLAAEALVHTQIVAGALKLATSRERPGHGLTSGHFGNFGNVSFPSGHAMGSWALASVVAHEYSGHKFVPILAYGLASAVSASRIGAQQHFASDVLVGSALGWLLGRYVHRRHMDAPDTAVRSRLMPQISPSVSRGGLALALSWNLAGPAATLAVRAMCPRVPPS